MGSPGPPPTPERPTIVVATPPGGWGVPWPQVAEIAAALPGDTWTLVGGLMAQLHAVHRGLDTVRPTNDVDIVLHIETERGIPRRAADVLVALGYQLQRSLSRDVDIAHRFVRGDGGRVDLLTHRDVVDVMAADHAAPRIRETLLGHAMLEVPGGTQALRRTVNAQLDIDGQASTISVPRPFGALVLKAAAYTADARDRERHLVDAVTLLACVEDPVGERDGFTGSDLSRMLTLARALPAGARGWESLPRAVRQDAQQALTILSTARSV